MNKKNEIFAQCYNQRGAAGLMVTLLIFVFIGVAALGIDVYHNFVILGNELQNAADAGALAGAAELYTDDGPSINTGANEVAQHVAQENLTTALPQQTTDGSNRLAPEVAANTSTNTWDVQRGHWSFGLSDPNERGFYPSESTDIPSLWDYTEEELDDPDNVPIFINAVRVIARRQATPIVTFFARIFGIGATTLTREAVAYLGFAGPINPGEVDQPIAICEESISDDDGVTCNIGRMINSGQDVQSHETGGWTDFCQEDSGPGCEGDPCAGGTNAQTVRGLVCADGNPYQLNSGDMATSGGEIQSAFNDLVDCWDDNTIINNLTDDDIDEWCENYSTLAEFIAAHSGLEDAIGENANYIRRTWGMTLPVISCPSNNVGTCEDFRGAIEVIVAWINNQTDPQYNNVPRALFGPDCEPLWPLDDETSNIIFMEDDTQEQRIDIWTSFASDPDSPVEDLPVGLNLQNVDGSPAPYNQKSIYFRPNCEPHEPAGGTGGQNFGILAQIPVLVCPDKFSNVDSSTGCCAGGATGCNPHWVPAPSGP